MLTPPPGLPITLQPVSNGIPYLFLSEHSRTNQPVIATIPVHVQCSSAHDDTMGQFHSALCAFAQTIGKKRKELETAPAFLRPLLEQTVAAYEVDYLLQYEQLRRIDAMFEGFARLKMDTKMGLGYGGIAF